MSETPTTAKHVHGEAFRLMTYRADDGTEAESIWNSRDGVTPFVITLRSGKQATHVNWSDDRYAPDHKPKPGDRIFVDITQERAREAAQPNAREWWDGNVAGAQQAYESAEALADMLAADYFQPGAPDLIEVPAEPAVVTGPDSEGLQAAQWQTFSSREDWLRDQHAKYHDEPGNLLGRDDCEWQRCAFWDAASHVLDAMPSSPVVPSVGAVPVEVTEAEFDFMLTNTIAEAVLNGPGEWIGIGAELALLASVVREKVKPLIAARVRAEAEAEIRQARAERDHQAALRAEYCSRWEAAERAAARVRAEERQRIASELALLLGRMRRTNFWEIGRESWLGVEREIQSIAGSAVPVATEVVTPTEPVVKLTRDTLDDGWVAEFSPIPGCMSQGETIPEALRGLADALTETVAAIVDAMDAPAEQGDRR